MKGKSPTEYAKSIIDMESKKTDPQGSYTGLPDGEYDRPVQDADDL